MATPFGLQAKNYNIKADIFNSSSVTSGNNLLSKDVYTDIWPAAEWSMYIVMVGSGILTLKRTQIATATSASELQNTGLALTANSAYIVPFFVSKGESINFTYSVTSVISKLIIKEIVSPT